MGVIVMLCVGYDSDGNDGSCVSDRRSGVGVIDLIYIYIA